MKVEGPGKAGSVKGASKTDKKRTGDGAFGALIGDAEESQPQAPVTRPAAVGAIDSLLALQGAESGISGEAAKKARKRAAELLDQLDQVKMGLLTGALPRATLQQLSQTIGTHRDKVMDSKLAEILDDIDLRAQVELAKLQQ